MSKLTTEGMRKGITMRVQYFVQYFKPEKSSGGYLVTDLLEGFVQAGWEVDVYTPTPTRGVTEKTRKEYCKMPLEILENGKLRIHRMPLYREGSGFVPRAIRYMLFSLQCLFKGLTEPADLIFTGSGPPTQGLVGAIIKKVTKKKFVYNLQDAFPDSLITSGMATEKSIAVKIGRIMERIIYRNADAIITISEDMRQRLLDKSVPDSRLFVVHNWIDTNMICPMEREDNFLFDELLLPRDKFYVTYAGNLGYVQGVEIIVDAAKILQKESDIQFVIFGNGSEEEKIRERIVRSGLNNIHLFPLQSSNRMSEVYSLGDVSVVTCKAGTGGSGMPSKTSLIMAAGTSIVSAFDIPSELNTVLSKADCGICVPAEDAEAFSKVILHMAQNRDVCLEKGKNGRNYALTNLSKCSSVSKYVAAIKSISN